LNITIHKAIVIDYEIIKTILDENDSFHQQFLPEIFQDPKGKSWNKEYVISIINNTDSDILLAKVNDKVVGVMVLIIKSNQDLAILKPRKFVALDSIAVTREFQNKGIGKLLLKRMEEWAYEKKIDQIELNVYEFNYNVIRLYESLGFRTYSRRMIKTLNNE
jgi:ribosomal protein S18 acetylase RimI-like enzyme